MSDLSTNLNVNPFFDDFDESKDFYRILFRPRVPVQARELTQIQTMIQKQIQRFGNHVFDNGSVVDGIHVTYQTPMKYVSVVNSFFANNALQINSIDDSYTLVGNTSGVRAVVLTSKTGFEATFPNSNRFYVNYVYSGNVYTEFQRGEYVRVYNSNQNTLDVLNEGNFVDKIMVIDNVATTGNAYGVTVSDGIIYHKGYFETVASQTVVVKDFDTDPTGYRVGFDTAESIVTEDVDSSLTDNALGYPNFSAPGAHRLKLVPSLVVKLKADVINNPNFFSIIEFDGSTPTEQNTTASYDALGDEFATRTSEEAGDYVVKPFSIETFPGVNANSNLVDANLFAYSLSTGIAYVKGYRVEKIGTSNVVAPRGITSATAQSQIVTANYGNYVVVSEMMGHFDWKTYAEVTLYDTAQTTITSGTKASGARAGNIIGYANVRAVEYLTGTKGIPTGRYIVYLENIRMNTGKAFGSGVKSIYMSGTYGAARADVVTVSNFYANNSTYQAAQLVDSTLRTMIFPLGTRAVKSLADNTGATTTQFVFQDVANATLQVNGFISVTINPAGPGGAERINGSGNITSIGDKENYDVVLTTDVFTANLSGTVSVNTTTTNVVGTSTSFSTQFITGSYIRIGTDSRLINQVVNTTFMNVTSAFSVTNASANYARQYLEGSHIDITSTSANVVITSNTTMNISTFLNLGGVVNATSTVRVTYPVLKHNTNPAGKDVQKNIYVKIDCSNNAAGSAGPWSLGLIDVYSISNVYVGATYSNTNQDVSSWFTLNSGQKDSYYDISTLSINPQYASQISGTTKMLIALNRFGSNTANGIGFFSVDSYPTSNTVSNTTILWSEIPSYTSQDGTFYDLRDCVDFRARVANTAVAATTDAAATINPTMGSVNTFSTATLGYQPAPDTNFQTDIRYYLPRRDLVVMNKSGDLAVMQGQPAVNPVTPQADNDVMVIAEAYVTPWPTLTQRESVDVGRPDLKVTQNIKTNRRYTMKDIGSLDQRLTRIEYYTVLNALEQAAANFNVPDSNGLDRFKNGIFADPFNSHAFGKVTDFEYKISIDQAKSIARPYFARHQTDFVYLSNSSTTQNTGNYVTLPYSHELFISQPYASKYRNCTESNWNWTGKLNLYPSYDDYRDETELPNINTTIDLTAAWEDFANSPYGTQYGDWRTVSSNTVTTSAPSGSGGTAVTSTTTTTSQQTASKINVTTMTNTYDLGTYVQDVSIEPYMRSRLVAFTATNLKPNTALHFFFDNVNVDAYIAAGAYSNLTNVEAGREDKILNRTGDFGAPMTSDSSGTILGIFLIPDATFRVGDRTFRVTDVADLVTGADASVTGADARYSASNIAITTQGRTLTTIEPEVSVVQSTNTITTVASTTTQIPPTTPNGNGPQETSYGSKTMNPSWNDPIAQSFFSIIPSGSSGMFVSKVDLFFQQTDPTLGVTLILCEMRLGNPDTTKILGKAYMNATNVVSSNDASAATTFVFNHPIFINAASTYAFMVKPDGDSPEYRIWLGETGGYDVASGSQIYQNPYAGVAFVSANMDTWTALQTEDIKFNLYRANFNVGSATAVFVNETDEFLTFSGLIRGANGSPLQAGDLCYTANATNTLFGANTAQPYGIVHYVDETSGTLTIDSSTGGWAASQQIQFFRPSAAGNTSLINANTLMANATVASVNDYNYHAVVPRFSVISPIRTTLAFAFAGTSNANAIDSAAFQTINDTEYEFRDTTRLAKSYSNELTQLGGAKSSTHYVTFSTNDTYVSPVIDLRRKTTLFIENLINANTTGEANSRYGGASTKYLCQNVILADGQESDDMHVTVSAYRPSGTDVQVYLKVLNSEDGEAFDLKAWTQLSPNGSFNYSSTSNTANYIDYDYGIPAAAPNTNPTAAYIDANTGILSYTRTDGALFQTYKTFSIKIVLTSTNAAIVPFLDDVRAISLQA